MCFCFFPNYLVQFKYLHSAFFIDLNRSVIIKVSAAFYSLDAILLNKVNIRQNGVVLNITRCFYAFQMSRYREWDLSCKVYVGNLGTNASKYEIEKVFSKYGNIRNVWVARNPPGFAFVEYEDPRDAEDSVRGLDGT